MYVSLFLLSVFSSGTWVDLEHVVLSSFTRLLLHNNRLDCLPAGSLDRACFGCEFKPMYGVKQQRKPTA